MLEGGARRRGERNDRFLRQANFGTERRDVAAQALQLVASARAVWRVRRLPLRVRLQS